MRSGPRSPAWQRVPSPLSDFTSADLTLPKLLDWNAERGGDKPFVTAGGATRSARQMRDEVARWGAGTDPSRPPSRLAFDGAALEAETDGSLASERISVVQVSLGADRVDAAP